MSFEQKRKKIDGEAPPPPPPHPPARRAFIQPPKRRATDTTAVVIAQTSSVIQERDAAVAQARQDKTTGNFRIFDSPFRNFLVPVIPTLADLAGPAFK